MEARILESLENKFLVSGEISLSFFLSNHGSSNFGIFLEKFESKISLSSFRIIKARILESLENKFLEKSLFLSFLRILLQIPLLPFLSNF